MMAGRPGRVLIVAGSDSGGGAGIQADIKTVTALGGYAATAIAALTAQNTRGVFAVLDVPADFVVRQIEVVLDDIGADCIKIGMLHRPDVVEAVCGTLARLAPAIPVVVDPVMQAKGGQPLLEDAAVDVLRRRLVPMARVLTPNLPEAAALVAEAGLPAETLARRLLDLGPAAVLLKGGHGEGPMLVDVLAEADRPVERFESPRLATAHTHGTGCTLASAIATGLAQGMGVRDAVVRARAYVREAIRTAPGLGGGHGPLNHGHTVAPFFPGG
jgi:hydroxymethylpyrimidine/phosphomethylpyrimidine kinase